MSPEETSAEREDRLVAEVERLEKAIREARATINRHLRTASFDDQFNWMAKLWRDLGTAIRKPHSPSPP